ncbi:Lrp/AsnC family transcriptional regulator [Streptomyces massasporeus]|uniref:Lrp/AsnC family transcriptional regulator n=1 Tax=Streptomyces massasporeus TaxID=67324 RepID=UPI0036E6F11A
MDRAILDQLQCHGRAPDVDLAEAVRLSPSSCLRRTKALEGDGVLVGNRAGRTRATARLALLSGHLYGSAPMPGPRSNAGSAVSSGTGPWRPGSTNVRLGSR